VGVGRWLVYLAVRGWVCDAGRQTVQTGRQAGSTQAEVVVVVEIVFSFRYSWWWWAKQGRASGQRAVLCCAGAAKRDVLRAESQREERGVCTITVVALERCATATRSTCSSGE
jgi:hypothetical protein